MYNKQPKQMSKRQSGCAEAGIRRVFYTIKALFAIESRENVQNVQNFFILFTDF